MKVGDYVEVLPGNYNERGDNLYAMRGVVKKIDDVFAYVKMDPYYRMRDLQRVFPAGLKRVKREKREVAIEVVETTKTYDVEAHVWCGGISHFLWEVGAKEGRQPNPFDGLTKLKGKGGRLRITMKVEVLKAGQETKPFHLTGCLCCNTHEAAKGKMHIALSDSPGFAPHNMEKNSGVYCGLLGQPFDWPKGHHWVSPTPGRLERADCKACLEAYAQHEKS